MTYRSYKPQRPLSDYIDSFWLYEGSPPEHRIERVLPTGSMELSINLQDIPLRIYDPQTGDQVQSLRGPLIGGPHSRCFVMDARWQSAIIGLHFKPGGAAPFFNVPASELHNAVLSLDMLWGTEAWDLQNQLFMAVTPTRRFHEFEQALLGRLSSNASKHAVVSFALRELQHKAKILPYTYPPNLSQRGTIANLVDRTGLSHRRFVQLFTEATGLTPKLFWRVQRFQVALRLIRRAARVEGTGPGVPGRLMTWSEIALACGYFDQSHFIRDFQAFSGLAPTAYLATQSESMNHVPLSD